MISKYQTVLNEFLESTKDAEKMRKHLPDSLCGEISSLEDFKIFLRFAFDNQDDGDRLEYGCHDSVEFIGRIVKNLNNEEEIISHARSQGINTELGLLAYAMIIALGN